MHWPSLASIGVRGATVLAGFVIAFLIGGRLGPEALGTYALVTQTAMFLSIVAVGGLDLSIVRHFPVIADQPAFARNSVVRLFLACLATCLVLSAAVMLLGKHFFALFEEVEADELLLALLSGIFVSRAFTRITSAFLRSQRFYVFSQVVEGLLIPLPVIALILFGWSEDVRQILLATVAFGFLAICVGVISSLRQTSGAGEGRKVSLSPLYLTALPLWGVAIIKNFGDWYSLSVVGSQLSVADAGLYRIALQISSSLAIITIGIFGVFSPQIGTAVAQERPDKVAILARTATRLSLALAVPAILILGFGSGLILGLIGPEFADARVPLLILLAGQLIYMATGPSGIVLALMGRQSINLYISIAVFLALLFMIPIAANQYGLIGAAAAVAVIMAAQNFATFVAVRILLRIDIWSGRSLKVADQT